MKIIIIKNWEKFQHYKYRKPPWIKLYRDLLDKKEWRNLSHLAGRLLIELWLLACENNDAKVNGDSSWLAWRLRYASNVISEIDKALKELEDQDFIDIESKPLARRKRDAIPETEAKAETKKETDIATKLSVSLINLTSKALGRKLVTTERSTKGSIQILMKRGVSQQDIAGTILWLVGPNLKNERRFDVQSGQALLNKWDRIQLAMSKNGSHGSSKLIRMDYFAKLDYAKSFNAMNKAGDQDGISKLFTKIRDNFGPDAVKFVKKEARAQAQS